MLNAVLTHNIYKKPFYSDIKYLQKNIFQFYSVCFIVKYLIKSKIFSVNQIYLSKSM